MKIIVRLLLSAMAVIVMSDFLEGITVSNYATIIIIALTIALLNLVIKPVLILFTLPVTVFTLGIFMLMVNAVIILLADTLINDFKVASIWAVVGFSVLLSVTQPVLYMFFNSK